MQNTLKGWLADNTVTADTKDDKILLLNSAGSVDLNKIYEEMIAGTNEACGITLTNESGVVTKLDEDMVPTNKPSELLPLLPSNLGNGTYTLTVTTQYTGNATLKEPRSVSTPLVISGGGGSGEKPDDL